VSDPLLAIVSITGKDQKGVVARISTHLAERSANIEDIEQHVVQGLFVMNMLVDIRDMSVRLDELITGLLAIGNEIGMEIKVHLHAEPRRAKIAVLVTREPHCLAQIADDVHSGLLQADIVGVFGNREELRGEAESRGFSFDWKPCDKDDKEPHFHWLQERLETAGAELVALARYMQIIPAWMCERWRGKMINIHPSLLPFYPGPNAYRQAYEAGARVAGCSAHYVTEKLDEGPIIFQDVFRIDSASESVDEVKENGRRLEGRTLSKALQLHVNDEILIHQGKVVFRPRPAHFGHRGEANKSA
jgi:formyltetrahydrofolate deformylase